MRSGAGEADERLAVADVPAAFTIRIADMTDGAGDDIVQVADLAVLVVQAGAKASTVSAMLRQLENYGVTPRWSIMVKPADIRGHRP
jgi:hypothetical protein